MEYTKEHRRPEDSIMARIEQVKECYHEVDSRNSNDQRNDVIGNDESQRLDANNPIHNAGVFSRVCQSWTTGYIYSTYKKGFDPNDWPSMPSYDSCTWNGDRLEKLWHLELACNGKENASLRKVIWRFIRIRFIASIIVFAISIVCGFFSQMVLMRRLLEHVDDADGSYGTGTMYALLLGLVELLRMFFVVWSIEIGLRTGIRLKVACASILYRKIIQFNRLGKTSTAEVINLLSADSQRISDMTVYGPTFMGAPVLVLGGIWYITWFLGSRALFGMLVFALFFPVQYGLSKIAGYLRGKTLILSDSRVRLIQEILGCAKLVKMYAWEKFFSENLLGIRKQELNLVLKTMHCFLAGVSLAPCIPAIATVLTMIAHTSSGENLTAAQAFTVSAFLSSQMAPMLFRVKESFQAFVDSSVAFTRLQRVLLLENGLCIVSKPPTSIHAIVITGGTFTYDAYSSQAKEHIKDFGDGQKIPQTSISGSSMGVARDGSKSETVHVLSGISFEVAKGKLIGICGSVGSGKSSLLMAGLGQLCAIEGEVMRDGSCAYVSQQAWVMNATLKDNILFGEPFDAERYENAVSASNLHYDLEMMPGRDLAEIGERGINLSGGQKQRVALARALYANRDIYFLDDPLSAVDAHVGSYIFDNLILGALRGKTVLLVTHQIQYLNRCDEIYMMREGRIVNHGTHEELLLNEPEYAVMADSIASESIKSVDSMAIDGKIHVRARLGQIVPLHGENQSISNGYSSQLTISNNRNLSGSDTTLIEAEKNEIGNVKLGTFLSYVEAAGGWFTACILFILTVLSAASVSFTTWWLTEWLNAGGDIHTDPQTNVTVVSNNINDNPDLNYYRTVYASGIAMILVSSLLRNAIFCKSSVKASTKLHDKLLKKVMGSPMHFFDTTPIGRLQNIFSREMDEVDLRLPVNINVVTFSMIQIVIAFIIVCSIFPWFILPMSIVSFMYYFIARLFRESLRSLRRIESTKRSPLLSHVTATVQGLNTIRAFEKDTDFESRFNKLVDESAVYSFLGFTVQRWLAVRIEALCILMISITAILVACTKDQIATASSGLALNFTVFVASIFQYLIRMTTDTEAQFVSVERIYQYINLTESEEDPISALAEVKTNWPSRAILKFENVSMSYRKNTPLVLHSISFVVKSQEKIGIVGRTGSGKSSLTVALFRLAELSGGRIKIDDVDISKVRLDQLRSCLSIIPQDPVLFIGTIRTNLDPFGVNDDAQIWHALEKTKMKERILAIDRQLDANVSFGGDNLSVGEKQLLCLARALLRRSKILVLDEATAAVDPETEAAVQSTIHREFAEATVLTIAHRLQTVLSCDRILVMDNGRIAEFDTPSNLLANENSQFSKLIEAAEKATRLP